MKRFFALFMLLVALPALAFDSVVVQQLIPTTFPQYSTNIIAKISGAFNIETPSGSVIASGQMATNGVAGNATNKAIWSTPIYLAGAAAGGFDYFWIEATWTTPAAQTNYLGTNFLWLYPVPDYVNVDTNDAIQLGSFTTPATNVTSGIFTSNVTSILSGCPFWQVGWGILGTNIATNIFVQIFASKRVQVTTTP
jgi:hypothetical protein